MGTTVTFGQYIDKVRSWFSPTPRRPRIGTIRHLSSLDLYDKLIHGSITLDEFSKTKLEPDLVIYIR